MTTKAIEDFEKRKKKKRKNKKQSNCNRGWDEKNDIATVCAEKAYNPDHSCEDMDHFSVFSFF